VNYRQGKADIGCRSEIYISTWTRLILMDRALDAYSALRVSVKFRGTEDETTVECGWGLDG
jgi:hypothetical protein